MKGLKTFQRGGIHPKGRKELTNTKKIVKADIPETLIVPFSQHLGAPAEVAVAAGDEVKEGMVIGKPSGFISAAIHSPVDGKIKEIKDIFLANGMKSKAAVIEKSEGFVPVEKKTQDWNNKTPEELTGIIKDSGIVGMGGATFPVNVKVSIPKGEKAEYLIVNGVECEPYLSADHRLMLERTSEIIEGLRILKKIVNPEKVAIGIEINKPDAIEAIRKKAAEEGFELDVIPLKLKYPQGDEKQLIKAVSGREVPSGGLPIAVGCVVINAGTVNAIYEAVVLEKPLYERVVSVSGNGIKNPGNYLTRVGTPVSALIEACGGTNGTPAKIVVGGPMMGFTIYDTETPVAKGTSGILVLTEKEVNAEKRTSCLSCGKCIGVCPMGLNPTKMFKFIDHSDYSGAMDIGLMDCKECGCCAYTCPAHIPLVQGMRLGKKMARKKVS
ncbi:MAG: electron transport complex subunit RsxC [Spirochaetales bacterium]|nr:electron transport complex subunit RsxC [Spirochaetales bacterium]